MWQARNYKTDLIPFHIKFVKTYLYVNYLKFQSARVTSHHSAFLGSRPTISHTFLALPTQWMSSPSKKWERGVRPRLHFLVFVLGVFQTERPMKERIFFLVLGLLSFGFRLLFFLLFKADYRSFPNRQILVQNPQLKHQNNVWNLLIIKKLIIKAPERRQWYPSHVFFVNLGRFLTLFYNFHF